MIGCPLEKEGVHVLMAHGGGCVPYSMDYGKIASGGFDYVGHGTYSPPAIWRGGKLYLLVSMVCLPPQV